MLQLIIKYSLVIIFIFQGILKAQTNLIQNPSFEYYTGSCYCGGTMTGAGLFDDFSVSPPEHKINNWYSFITPDYFNSICAVTNTNGVMYNELGNIHPKTGTAFVGLIGCSGAILGEVKEYIYQQLATPLIGGKTYCLSFYVSLADASTGGIKKIGAYFSNSLPNLNTSSYINATPQIENQNAIIVDTTNWVQIQGCFIANGGEQYITIGNFNSNANSNLLIVSTTYTIASDYPGYSYYYIDDITLIDQTAVEINELTINNAITLLPNPTNAIVTINSKFDMQQVEIINLAGQILLQENVNNKTHQLQLQSFADGIYFVKIVLENGMVLTKKVTKQ